MAFKMKYTIEQRYLPKGTKRRSGIKNQGIDFIVAHDSGNDGSTAAGNVNYYTNSANVVSASAHTFIDDKAIIECVPLTEKAWHVMYNVTTDNELYGFDSNDHAIGVELCYSYKKGNMNNKESYKRYVWYMAYLCYKFNLNPMKRISGHNELDPNRRTDPYKNALKIMGITKDQFLKDVVKEYAECTVAENLYSVYQGNSKLKDFPDYVSAVEYAQKWSNVNIRKITDGSWVWSNIKKESEDDCPMKLETWQKSMLTDGLNKLSEINGVDGTPLINDPEGWTKKVNNGTITAGELAIINFALISRQVIK
ncbi:N-acetylmuramoyl-L-alanine amidase family protein [Paenibacillus sp. NPDC057967]|uniref:peptidoglycan recognition protein family protein n=1 Tax=Paenibacillus sp. NPDC057967 TaxID=3346293 RepID=UPI0036D8124C